MDGHVMLRNQGTHCGIEIGPGRICGCNKSHKAKGGAKQPKMHLLFQQEALKLTMPEWRKGYLVRASVRIEKQT